MVVLVNVSLEAKKTDIAMNFFVDFSTDRQVKSGTINEEGTYIRCASAARGIICSKNECDGDQMQVPQDVTFSNVKDCLKYKVFSFINSIISRFKLKLMLFLFTFKATICCLRELRVGECHLSMCCRC